MRLGNTGFLLLTLYCGLVFSRSAGGRRAKYCAGIASLPSGVCVWAVACWVLGVLVFWRLGVGCWVFGCLAFWCWVFVYWVLGIGCGVLGVWVLGFWRLGVGVGYLGIWALGILVLGGWVSALDVRPGRPRRARGKLGAHGSDGMVGSEPFFSRTRFSAGAQIPGHIYGMKLPHLNPAARRLIRLPTVDAIFYIL